MPGPAGSYGLLISSIGVMFLVLSRRDLKHVHSRKRFVIGYSLVIAGMLFSMISIFTTSLEMKKPSPAVPAAATPQPESES